MYLTGLAIVTEQPVWPINLIPQAHATCGFRNCSHRSLLPISTPDMCLAFPSSGLPSLISKAFSFGYIISTFSFSFLFQSSSNFTVFSVDHEVFRRLVICMHDCQPVGCRIFHSYLP